MELDGISFVTTALAAITQPSPTIAPSKKTAPAPIQQLFPTLIPLFVTPCKRIRVLISSIL